MSSWGRQISKRLEAIESVFNIIHSALLEAQSSVADETKQEVLRKQLDRAHEIRKFEIELYWRRTTYFWTLIAAAFAGFFLVTSAKSLDSPGKQILSLVVAYFGFVLSLGWYYVNEGSKFWQENWESQVDWLEKQLNEYLYSLTALRSPYKLNEEGKLVGTKPISVSKVNKCICVHVGVVWAGLCIWSVWALLTCAAVKMRNWDGIGCIIVALIALLIVVFWTSFHVCCRTNLDDYCFQMKKRCVTKCDCCESACDEH